MDWGLWAPVIVAGALAGGSTALVGAYIVAMRVPFLGVCVSHAALAGAVWGLVAGLSGAGLFWPAMGGAAIAALGMGLGGLRRKSADANTAMGIVFVVMLGLTFLAIGLLNKMGRSQNESLGLLWGSLAFCTWRDVLYMATSAGALLAFCLLCGKEMRAILFSREHAAASGVHVTAVWTGFLLLVSITLSVHFRAVGGLMIYSLMICPAAATFRLVKGYFPSVAVCNALGAFSGVAGFLLSLWLDLPTGATIVLLSAGLVALAWGIDALTHRRIVRRASRRRNE